MKASHCDECLHGTPYPSRNFWNMRCAKSHKPRYYLPKHATDMDYGWKRNCSDFETKRLVEGEK